MQLDLEQKNNIYAQYGCGWCAPASWRNFDSSPTLRYERIPVLGKLYTKNASRFPENVEYGDIVKGLPIADESCKAIYCSHVLEHLALDDFRCAIRNTYNKLQGGGVFRLVLPDLEYYIKSYLDDRSENAALCFMRQTNLGYETRIRGLKGILFFMLGNNRHLWMWDYKSIEFELRNVGFREVRRAQFGDSADLMFSQVEDPARWENCLGVECRK